jgi:hypothetical protein
MEIGFLCGSKLVAGMVSNQTKFAGQMIEKTSEEIRSFMVQWESESQYKLLYPKLYF